MILCFTGTGNSRHVADKLQDIFGDEIVRLPPGLMAHPERVKLRVYDQRLIWVMPVHAWGLPTKVDEVMRKSEFIFAGDIIHHLVVTCGDDAGYIDKEWRARLKKIGGRPGSVFSVQMPNVYTFMPGFDIDSPEVQQAKLAGVDARVAKIADAVRNERTDVVDIERGTFPWIKSHVLRHWFHRFKTTVKPFYATDACTGCGKCARNCPTSAITMDSGRPAWSDTCLMCTRCYHVCPHHAIMYGKATKGKGQYICEGFSVNQ